MTITQEKVSGTTVMMTLSGRLDAANAPLLERKLKQWGVEITEIILDFAELTYISSMGLRVLLQTKKSAQADNRKLIIRNMNSTIREIFEMTGFLNFMVEEEQFIVIKKNEDGAVILSLNGQMRNDNVSTVLTELNTVKEAGIKTRKPITVILDMEKLTHIDPGAIRLLGKAVTETEWSGRSLCLRNVSVDLKAAIEEEDHDGLLAAVKVQ